MTTNAPHVLPPAPEARQRGGGHGFMMLACIPMLVIAIVLVATGAVSAGFIFVAVACAAMMALMMRGMNHGGMNRDGYTDPAPNQSGHLPPAVPPHTVRGRPTDR